MGELELYKTVGKKIKARRKSLNMSMSELASKINKSVPTVSKYESGKLMISLGDLLEICHILRMNLFSLLPDTGGSTASTDNSRFSKHFAEKFYIYWYNGEKGIIQKGVIENNNTLMKASLYFDYSDNFNYYKCNYFYSGDVYYNDTDIVGIFRNTDPPFDMITLRLPFLSGVGKPRVGILTCISEFYQSIAMKIIGTDSPIADEKSLKELLQLSANDLRSIKKTNFFTIR